MSKYICQICGYIYDDANDVKWEELPNNWKCPICGADKGSFVKLLEEENKNISDSTIKEDNNVDSFDDLREVSYGEMSAIFSNLARGCEKQYKMEEANLFTKLSEYYLSKINNRNTTINELQEKISNDLTNYIKVNKIANDCNDRGAKRVLTWSEKVTKMAESILSRYQKEGNKIFENTKIWVCDICGFIYIGDVPPAICPVCKVPNFKILEVK